MEPSQYCELLGWSKSSFRFFHKMLWKNSNGLYGQPNIKMCWLPSGVLDFLSFLTLLFFFKIQELKCVGHISMSLFALFALYLGQGRVEVLLVWLLLFLKYFQSPCFSAVHSGSTVVADELLMEPCFINTEVAEIMEPSSDSAPDPGPTGKITSLTAHQYLWTRPCLYLLYTNSGSTNNCPS